MDGVGGFTFQRSRNSPAAHTNGIVEEQIVLSVKIAWFGDILK